MAEATCKHCSAALVVKLNKNKAPHAACPNGCKGGKPKPAAAVAAPAGGPSSPAAAPAPAPAAPAPAAPAAAKRGFWWGAKSKAATS
jgi:hypothetical protein